MKPRLSVIAGLVAALMLLASPAFAHVTVNPRTAEKGGFAKLTFRVPNETDGANTTQVEVNFPTDEPLAFVSVKPVPGWTFAVEKAKLAKPISSDDGDVTEAVSKITWTGGKIGPGEFQEFDVSVGPLPSDASSMTFKALQTYDNGDIVRWIDVAKSAGEELEHPAPVLTLTDPAKAAVPTTTSSSSKSDGTARGLGIAGIVLGAAGIAAASRRGKKAATS